MLTLEGVAGEDGFEELQGSPAAVGEDLGVEISLPDPGDRKILQWAEQGEEIPGVVTVAPGGMVLQVDLPLPLHKGLQQALHHDLDPLRELPCDLFASLVRYRGLPSFLLKRFLQEGYYAASTDTLLETLPLRFG